jgi:hypothetical protein
VRDAEIGFRHVPRRLLVAGRDGPDRFRLVVEGVEQAHVAVAAKAEDTGHLLKDQV